MMISDRFMGAFRHEDNPLRWVSVLFGLNLILAGLIIFFFPEVLVFLISFAFIASGVGVIISAFRSGRHTGRQFSVWEYDRP